MSSSIKTSSSKKATSGNQPRNLVIVESPAKAKTIEKFLGKDYKVMSSFGHIRDLRKHGLGLDLEHGFSPDYEIPSDKARVVKELKAAAKEADTVWLASDEDREGEAIAWHLSEVLELKPENTRRIVFHEITKPAILRAIANPRGIDMGRVDAQQARRVLDRIVGFELSPVLWKRIKPALSAGRVQSATARLIVEREKEIRDFQPEIYYRVSGKFTTAEGKPFKADLSRRFATALEAKEFLEACAKSKMEVQDVSVKPLKKYPAPPFTTSTLQQEASRKLGFPVARTMSLAQKLYEAGHITYMRTDSENLSDEALQAISAEITGSLGSEYLKARKYHTKAKGAQEAHEAIRPTYPSRETLDDATPQEQKLYTLIRRRAIASQMAEAEMEKTTADISVEGRPETFSASGEVVKFDGFLRMYIETREEEQLEEHDGEIRLPKLTPGEKLTYNEILAMERFTQAPPRYTDHSLVKKMEELGIGRPSTYAPTISTIQQRGYVARGEKEGTERTYEVMTLAGGKITDEQRTETTGSDRGKLVPTDTGMVVNDFLTEFFPDILDYNFTARIEEKFDEVAEGKIPWTDEISSFYDVFHPEVDEAMARKSVAKFGERSLGIHPETGEPVSVKIGRYGPMVQIGNSESDEKPRFATLRDGQSLHDITLEEALKLFEFPRNLGEFEGSEVTVAIGKFGPYVRHAGKFASIPDDIAPAEVSLDKAIELILEKRASEAAKILKTFPEDESLQLINGRYGPYISYKKENYKIPKTVQDPEQLTFTEVMDIIKSAGEQKSSTSRARRTATGVRRKK